MCPCGLVGASFFHSCVIRVLSVLVYGPCLRCFWCLVCPCLRCFWCLACFWCVYVRSVGWKALIDLNFFLSAVHLLVGAADIVLLSLVMSPLNISVKSVDDRPAALSESWSDFFE